MQQQQREERATALIPGSIPMQGLPTGLRNGYKIKPYPEALLFLTTDTQQIQQCHCKAAPLINLFGLNPRGW